MNRLNALCLGLALFAAPTTGHATTRSQPIKVATGKRLLHEYARLYTTIGKFRIGAARVDRGYLFVGLPARGGEQRTGVVRLGGGRRDEKGLDRVVIHEHGQPL